MFDPEQTGNFAAELAEAARQEQNPPWCSWIAWLDDAPVAMGGFKGPPSAGDSVEIGYLTFAAHQGSGHASALVGFLVATAREAGMRTVLAHTLPEPNASTRVLEKNDFVRDGFGEDEDVGIVWRWKKATGKMFQ